MLLGKKFLSVLVAGVAAFGISANLVPKVSAAGGRLFEVRDVLELSDDTTMDKLLEMLPDEISNYEKAQYYYLHEILPFENFDEDCITNAMDPMKFDNKLVQRWDNCQFYQFLEKFPDHEELFPASRREESGHMSTREPNDFSAPLVWDFVRCDPNSCFPGGPAYEYVHANEDLLDENYLAQVINSLRKVVQKTNDTIDLLRTYCPEYGDLIESFEDASRDGTLDRDWEKWSLSIEQARNALGLPVQDPVH